MTIKIPEISKQIYSEDISKVIDVNYSKISGPWLKHQMDWVNGAYQTFKDHEKFLIIIYIVKKTLDFYSRNFVKIDFQTIYSKNMMEVEKFNIMELSKNLNIPKESARRKVIQLEEAGIIKRFKKKIIVDRSAYPYVQPLKSIERTSRFLSGLSRILTEEKILMRTIKSYEIESIIKKNFSYVWKLYYELQIPLLVEYGNYFTDLETWHIWGICASNRVDKFLKQNKNKSNKEDTINKIFLNADKTGGLNAMSISEITGIPRATVVRKLKKLIKSKNLTCDKKKQYHTSKNVKPHVTIIHTRMLERLSNLSAGVYNLFLTDDSLSKKNTSEPFYLNPILSKFK